MAIVISILISLLACANDGIEFTTIFTYLSIATTLLENTKDIQIRMITLLKNKVTKSDKAEFHDWLK